MNAVIYARYSPGPEQSESSIAGQLKECYSYAKREGYTVIREYIDRAISGTTDKRPQFQKMIKDSERERFSAVIVYQLDRFARNRYDSASNKFKLKKHGVKVVSAREIIAEDASGILMESVLEGMAEYYSAELSQKVKRGINLSVEQCKFIGGFLPLGYKLTDDKHYIIDPITAPIIPRIFDLYVAGRGLKEIGGIIKTEFGIEFGNVYNKLGNSILDNVNYKGTYTRGGNIVENAIPRLVSDEVFQQAQERRNKHKKTPAQARAYQEYILTTKLYCGVDREMMVGTGGTGKSGTTYHYYGCKNVINRKGCKKKNVKKSYIEDFVIAQARKQLDENIDLIVETVCEASRRENNAPQIAEIKRNIKETEKAIDNLLVAVERGENLDILMERLTKKKQEKSSLEIALAKAQMDTIEIDEKEIAYFFRQLQKGDIDDERARKALVAIFVNSIYLYDDKARIIFNATDRPITIDYELLNEIENLEKGVISSGKRCSYMNTTSPPIMFLWDLSL